ncbi:YebG family protein [Desulfosarcina sp. OttesenSCG-928-A07]|nr:YebG family protein [Desulfosarcina sp. OttesenSCG-928-G17]MDL2329689.1 YebG family protein [Desulfosarcina sp. OttesenSCG-928-A07]
MAVITKYVVVRNGIELDMIFLSKKDAEAYDKMLDAADSLASYIRDAGLDIDVDNDTITAISVFLAQNGPEVTRILKSVPSLKDVSPEASAASAMPKKKTASSKTADE